MAHKFARLLTILTLTAIVLSCSTSPRGRKQLLLLPEDQMASMGAQAFTDLKKQTPASKNPELNTYVRCIAEPLTKEVSGDEAKNWEIVVFDEDKTVNAFALPGGKIGVYTGLLHVAKTPSQVAAVVGHEIGHVIARHGNERASETLATQGGLATLGVILNEKGSNYGLLMGALGVGAQFGLLLPHSRTQESEADLIGLEIMAKAGFDPRESVALWKNMSAAGGGQPPEFLSTHPSNQTRIANLERTIPSVMPAYNKAATKPDCSRPSSLK